MTDSDNVDQQFVAIPNRDAWATIRGYVYQVEATVLRWLELNGRQELELESGEDIDVIQKGIGTELVPERILEQLKHREDNISLVSAPAIAAIARFYRYRVTNPDQALSFRFVTNAHIAKERMVDSRTQPGITVWEGLRLGHIKGTEVRLALLSIRKLLRSNRMPKDIAPDIWKGFLRHIQSNSQLLNLINGFEWSVGIVNFPALAGVIPQQIRNHVGDLPHDQVQMLFQRLFFHVFKTLSSRGVKRLSISDRETVLRGAISSADHSSMVAVARLLDLPATLQSVKRTISYHDQEISNLRATLEALVGFEAPIPSVGYSIKERSIDPPPRVTPHVDRGKARAVAELLETKTWCAFDGESGIGKSQLALQVAEHTQRRIIWVPLRGLTTDQALRTLGESISAATCLRRPVVMEPWYEEACNVLGPHTVVVIDDQPRSDNGSLLDQHLVAFSAAASRTKAKILSTSNDPLNPYILERLGNTLFKETIVGFDVAETAELLKAYSAPATLADEQLCQFIHGLTRGHPQLVAASARYFSSRNWKLDEESFELVFSGDYASELKVTTQRTFTNSVTDADTRELLYRLDLVGRTFTARDIDLVCQALPSLSHGGEKLAALIGPWVQRESANEYSVSSVLSGIGTDNVPSDTAKAIHYGLGLRFFENREVGPIEVFEAWGHFVSSDRSLEAGIVLALALYALSRSDAIVLDDWGIPQIWMESHLPSDIPMSLQIVLRALQLVILGRRGQDPSFIETNLQLLIAKAGTIEGMAIVSASLELAVALDHVKCAIANAAISRAVQLVPQMFSNGGTLLPPGTGLRTLLWLTTRGIRDSKTVRDWIDKIKQLTSEQRADLFSDDLAAEGSLGIANNIWSQEADKPASLREWERVDRLLDLLANEADDIGAGLLWASAIRMRIVVQGDELGKVDVAVQIAETALARASDPTQKFLIEEVMGRLLADVGRSESAHEWLCRAIDADVKDYAVLRRNALLVRARLELEMKTKPATAFSSRAVELMRTSDPSGFRLIEALGEHALLLLSEGDNPRAYHAWNEAASRLLAIRAESPEWRGLFIVSLRVTNLMFSRLVLPLPELSRMHEQIKPGLFLQTELCDEGRAIRVWQMAHQMALIAEAMGDMHGIKVWFDVFQSTTGPGEGQDLLHTIAHVNIPSALLRGDYEAAFAAALQESPPSGPTTKFVHSPEDGPIVRDLEGRLAVGLPHNLAAQVSLWRCVVPIAFQLLGTTAKMPQSSFSVANRISELCSRQLARAKAEAKPIWQAAHNAFAQGFSGRLSFQTLLEEGERAQMKRLHACAALYWIACMSRCNSGNALGILYGQAPLLMNYIGHATLSHVVFPAIREFWLERIARVPHEFNDPEATAASLTQVSAEDGNAKLRQLVSILHKSVGVPPLDRAAQWLRE